MSNKETKALRKNAKSGIMSDAMWKKHQEQSAKGSDSTITDDDLTQDLEKTAKEVSEEFKKAAENAPEGELNESEEKLLEDYEKRKASLK